MEDDWVVDSLIGYLQSPVWKVSIDNFAEEKCIGESVKIDIYAGIYKNYTTVVFGDEDGASEDLYHGIHAEYQNRVPIKNFYVAN